MIALVNLLYRITSVTELPALCIWIAADVIWVIRGNVTAYYATLWVLPVVAAGFLMAALHKAVQGHADIVSISVGLWNIWLWYSAWKNKPPRGKSKFKEAASNTIDEMMQRMRDLLVPRPQESGA